MNQRQLARALRINEGAVSKWFSDEERGPSLKALARMPGVLGVSLDWLVGVPSALPPTKRAPSRIDQRAVRQLIKALRDAQAAGLRVAASLSDEDEL